MNIDLLVVSFATILNFAGSMKKRGVYRPLEYHEVHNSRQQAFWSMLDCTRNLDTRQFILNMRILCQLDTDLAQPTCSKDSCSLTPLGYPRTRTWQCIEHDESGTEGQGYLLVHYDHIRHERAPGVSQGLQDKIPSHLLLRYQITTLMTLNWLETALEGTSGSL